VGEDAFAIIKKQATLNLEKVIASFDRVYDEKMFVPFSGVYSDEAEDTFEKINKAIAARRLVGAGTEKIVGKKSKGFAGETIKDGIAGTHAYSVLGTDVVEFEGKKIKMVKLRNPWGVTVPVYKKNEETGKVEIYESAEKTNGVFLCELTQFVQRYDKLYNA
jgi:hypothetical protein